MQKLAVAQCAQIVLRAHSQPYQGQFPERLVNVVVLVSIHRVEELQISPLAKTAWQANFRQFRVLVQRAIAFHVDLANIPQHLELSAAWCVSCVIQESSRIRWATRTIHFVKTVLGASTRHNAA